MQNLLIRNVDASTSTRLNMLARQAGQTRQAFLVAKLSEIADEQFSESGTPALWNAFFRRISPALNALMVALIEQEHSSIYIEFDAEAGRLLLQQSPIIN